MVEDLDMSAEFIRKEEKTYSLGEGLSTGSLSEIGVESERLGDGEVGWLLVKEHHNWTHPSWCTWGYLVAARRK